MFNLSKATPQGDPVPAAPRSLIQSADGAGCWS